jgi:hypothetical protein
MMLLFMMLSWDVHCAQFPLLVKIKLLLTGEKYTMSATSKLIQLLFVPSPLKIPAFVIPVVFWKMTAVALWHYGITADNIPNLKIAFYDGAIFRQKKGHSIDQWAAEVRSASAVLTKVNSVTKPGQRV